MKRRDQTVMSFTPDLLRKIQFDLSRQTQAERRTSVLQDVTLVPNVIVVLTIRSSSPMRAGA
ncbi:hypothetical protein D9758_014331 [Tetrapyrgos nigripes]|uniref:Uncharacterized protein n=1 Tax=Tetrapyrgos nigripes TaxID=182062 RepID=A0A8H5FIG1_9AGAR|nr:hypothetical protein D9758_014331 [Tetrapyrgos nigripes]